MNREHKYTNHLIGEASPYLLQHAHNPVDWYPWGEEAFQKAREEDKPVFLSIGYSTCHWCHVMAHESFEDREVAALLNEGFVSVKVDREKRPDIDEVYMSVCQALTGGGGWPLSIFMTADKKPFFAGTYYPKRGAYGRIGLIELGQNILRLWHTDRETLLKNSDAIIQHIKSDSGDSAETQNAKELIRRCHEGLKASFDREYGGFSISPKFPASHNILFLLMYAKAYQDQGALHMAEHTLQMMYRGGIFDHVGGGFSRYATDREWLIPHFEKMLYDNAMLLLAFSEALAYTEKPEYKTVIDSIARYVLRDMQAENGGFFSAEDADSQGEEGRFYAFSYDELQALLNKEELRFLETEYGISRQGNFDGKNILHRTNGGRGGEDILRKLYDYRDKRVRPFKDTKVSVSWNGLLIQALCRAGEVTGNRAYINSAKRAADFILKQTDDCGELFGIYKDGAQASTAFLADYANFATGLLSLFEASTDVSCLHAAQALAGRMVQLFWDEGERRFYMTREGDDELFVRPRDEYDGAMPSGNSRAIGLLGRLKELTGDEQFKELFNQAVNGFMPTAARKPMAHVHFVSSLLQQSRPHRQIIISADREHTEAMEAYRHLLSEYLPFTTLIYFDRSDKARKAFPLLADMNETQPFAAYICENFACQSPVYDIRAFLKKCGLSGD